MDFLNIEVPVGVKLYVVGDIHEHSQQFLDLLEIVKPSPERWLVSLGDCFDKGFGVAEANKITRKLMQLQAEGYCFAIRGNHELKVIRKAKKNLTPELKWWKDQPLSLSFKFKSGTRVTCVHAGVEPGMEWSDLKSNVEICYVRDIDDNGKMIPLVWKEKDGKSTLVKAKEGGKTWHETYNGRFGYIVSGHAAQKDGEAKFYNYSCNLDSGVYETGILTCQEFDNDGNPAEKIIIKGEAAKPKLDIG